MMQHADYNIRCPQIWVNYKWKLVRRIYKTLYKMYLRVSISIDWSITEEKKKTDPRLIYTLTTKDLPPST